MFDSLAPCALVGLSIEVVHNPEAMPKSVLVLPAVGVAIGPEILPLAMFLVVGPVPSVALPIV